jgi:hypothetical protein
VEREPAGARHRAGLHGCASHIVIGPAAVVAGAHEHVGDMSQLEGEADERLAQLPFGTVPRRVTRRAERNIVGRYVRPPTTKRI